MTTKEWLNRGWRLNTEIDALLEERRRAFELATSATSFPQPDKVQSSHENSTADRFTNYAAYSRKIDDRIDELYRVKNEIMDAIGGVDNPVYRTLLVERYINFKTWEQVAWGMNYDYYHVIKVLHKKALESINIPQNTTL